MVILPILTPSLFFDHLPQTVIVPDGGVIAKSEKTIFFLHASFLRTSMYCLVVAPLKNTSFG